MNFFNICDVKINASLIKSKLTVYIQYTQCEAKQTNIFSNIFSNILDNIFNNNRINIPKIEFNHIPLPWEYVTNLVNYNTSLVSYNFNYVFNLAIHQHNSLDYIYRLLMENVQLQSLFTILIMVLGKTFLFWLINLIITLFSLVVDVFKSILKYVSENLFVSLAIIFSMFIIGADAFSFTDSISEYTTLSLDDIRNKILGVSGSLWLVFGIVFDFLSLCFHVLKVLPEQNTSTFIHFMWLGLINTCGAIWISSGVFFTNTLSAVTTGISPLTSFLVGSPVAILCTALWDFLSVSTPLFGSNLINSFFRFVTDSFSFTGIVYSTFASWNWYNVNDLTRLVAAVLGPFLGLFSAYLMHVQMLVRILPGNSFSNIRVLNIWFGRFILWLNSLSEENQERVTSTRWPLFRQSIYFSLLWNITWNILVFATNPLIEYWTNLANSEDGNRNLYSWIIFFVCLILTIVSTPSYYFRFVFDDNSSYSTGYLLLKSIIFVIYTYSYIMLEAVGYNMFWG